MALSNNNTPLTFEEAIARLEKNKERAEKLDEAYSVYMDEGTDFNSLFGQWFKNLGCTSKEEFDRWSKGLLEDYGQWKKKKAEQPINPENEPDIDSNGLRLSSKDIINSDLKQYILNTRPGNISVETAKGLNMQYEREDFIDIIDAIDNIVRDTKARMDIIRKAYKNENRDANFEDKLLPLVASIVVWKTIKEANNKRKKSSNVSLEEYYPNSEYMTALINGTVKVKWTNKLDLTNIISPKFIKIRQEAKEKELNNKGYIFSLRAVLQRLGYDIDDMGYIEIPTMLDKSLGTVFDKCYFLVNIDDVWYGLNQDGYCTVEDSWINQFNRGGSTSVSARGSKVYNKKTETKLNVAQLSEKEAKELYQIASGKKIPKEKKQKEKVPPKTPEERRDERMARQAKRNANATFRIKQQINKSQLVTLNRQIVDLNRKITTKQRELIIAQRQRNTSSFASINNEIQELYQQLAKINETLNSARNEKIDIQYEQETKATTGKGLFNLFGGGGDNR